MLRGTKTQKQTGKITDAFVMDCLEKAKTDPDYRTQLTQLLNEKMPMQPMQPLEDISKLSEKQRKARSEIEKIFNNSQVQSYFKDCKNFLDQPADTFIKELLGYTEVKRKEKIQNINFAFQFCAEIGSQLKDRKIEKFGLGAQSVMQMYAGVAEIMATGAALGPAGLIATGAFSLWKVLSMEKTKEDPFPKFLNDRFNELKNLVQGLYSCFEKSFENDRIIYNTLCQGFAHLESLINDGFRDLAVPTMRSLNALETNQNRLFDFVKIGFDANLLKDFRKLLNDAEHLMTWAEDKQPKELDKQEVRKLHNALYDVLRFENGTAGHDFHTGVALLQGYKHSGKDGNLDEWTCNVLNDVSEDALHDLVGYLACYATSVLKVEFNPNLAQQKQTIKTVETKEEKNLETKEDNDSKPITTSHYPVQLTSINTNALFNPTIWVAGVSRYHKFIRYFRALEFDFDPKGRYLDDVILAGENMLGFIQAVQTTPDLFAKLFDQYQKAILRMEQLLDQAFLDQNNVINSGIQKRFPDEAKVAIDLRSSVDTNLALLNGRGPISKVKRIEYYCGYLLIHVKQATAINSPSHYYYDFNEQKLTPADCPVKLQVPASLLLLELLGKGEFDLKYGGYLMNPWASIIGYLYVNVDFKHEFKSETKAEKKDDEVMRIIYEIEKCPSNAEYDPETCNNLAGYFYWTWNGKSPTARPVMESYWQRKKPNDANLTKTTFNQEAVTVAERRVEEFFLEQRKLAVRNALNEAKYPILKNLFSMLDANLRLLKAYATFAGFRAAELQAIHALPNSEQVRASLMQYVENPATNMATLLPHANFVPNFDRTKTTILQKVQTYSPDYYQYKTQQVIQERLHRLNFLKVLRGISPIPMRESKDEKDSHATPSNAQAEHDRIALETAKKLQQEQTARAEAAEAKIKQNERLELAERNGMMLADAALSRFLGTDIQERTLRFCFAKYTQEERRKLLKGLQTRSLEHMQKFYEQGNDAAGKKMSKQIKKLKENTSKLILDDKLVLTNRTLFLEEPTSRRAASNTAAQTNFFVTAVRANEPVVGNTTSTESKDTPSAQPSPAMTIQPPLNNDSYDISQDDDYEFVNLTDVHRI